MKLLFNFGILLILFHAISCTSTKGFPRKIRLPQQLEEVSGLWIQSPDSLWWHNDGGHAPALICTNLEGEVLEEIVLDGLKNIDWEDLTADDKGNIYIGDFGNNRNNRRDLKIYKYNRVRDKVDTLHLEYAAQKVFKKGNLYPHFDMEAFFYYNDSLHLFSKNNVAAKKFEVHHYIIPAQAGHHILKKAGSKILRKRVISAAAIRSDGKIVALTGYNYGRFLGFIPWSKSSVFLISDFPKNRFLEGKVVQKSAPGFLWPRQYEGVDFIDKNKLYIGSEGIFFTRPRANLFLIKTE